MGYSTRTIYNDKQVQDKVDSGTAFGYTAQVNSGAAPAVAHGVLSPYVPSWKNPMRECRVSVDHPNAKGAIIALDVTGSNHSAKTVYSKLPLLYSLLVTSKAYAPDVALLISAVGDVLSDNVPTQFGQFEADSAIDKSLEALYLEGGGGAQGSESYELLLYLAARHTDQDCWKNGEKGYLFIIGDEMARDVDRNAVRKVIGDTLEGDIPLQQIVDEVKEKYHLYFILPRNSSYGSSQTVINFWKNLLDPEHFIRLEDENMVAELIALTIGLQEGTATIDNARTDLLNAGVDARTIDAVTTALAPVTNSVTTFAVASEAIDHDAPAARRRI